MNAKLLKNFFSHHITQLCLAGIVVFAPLLTFSFLIGWDDQIYVLNRYTESGLAIKNIIAIITEFYYSQYAPLNQLYYSAIFEFFGYKPAYFHACSMVIHIANSVLVYLFVNQITEKLFTEASGKKHISFITALLFLIAPINLEPVAWIAASKVLIYAFFYLLSLIFYVKYIKSVCSKYYYYTLVCFILSFAAKEQALTLPLAMLLLDNLYGREFKRALLWWEKMPPLLLSFLFVLASFQSQGRFVFISTESYELTDRLLLSFYTVSEYFTQILLPVNLCYVYPFPFLPGNSPPMWLWLFPVCIILATYFLRHILLQKHVLFGAGFFFAHIIMVCNLVSLSRHSIVADRYAYIASIGLLWLLCVAGSELLNKARRVQKLYYKGLFAIYIIYFLTYTSVHLWVWQNAVELKQKMRNEIIKRGDYDVQ